MTHSEGGYLPETRQSLAGLGEPQYRMLLEHLQDGVFLTCDSRFVFVNGALAAMVGYAVDDLVGQPISLIVAPEDRTRVQENHDLRVAGTVLPDMYEFRMLKKDGVTRVDVSFSVGLVTLPDGRVATLGSVKDITAKKQLFEQLVQSEQEFRLIVENMPDIFYRTDADGIVTMISPSVSALGWTPREVAGRPLADFYADPRDRDRVFTALCRNEGQRTRVEVRMLKKDGGLAWVEANTFFRWGPDGVVTGVEGIARDITDRKELEDRLTHLAHHDPLTDLPNRSLMTARLERAVVRARAQGKRLALLFIDLDGFKQVNDCLGHEAGDAVLTVAAQRLRECVRGSDLAARLGGDEFTVILEDDAAPALAERVAARILESLSAPYAIAGCRCDAVSASIGIAHYPDHGESADALLSHADGAMYEAKRAGRRRVVTWTPALHQAPDEAD